MTRLLLALAGVVLLAVTALAAVWLLGQLLTGLGLFIVGAAGVLGRLLWFLLITGVLAGVVYFVASAWRPSVRAPVRPFRAQPEARRPASGSPKRGRAGQPVAPAPVSPTPAGPGSVSAAPTPPTPAETTPAEAAPTGAVESEPVTSGPVRSGG